MTEVVAALIWNGNRSLICQRPAHKSRGLLWEFVGGRVEPGATKEQAQIWMCNLTLFHAEIREEVPRMLEHNAGGFCRCLSSEWVRS